MPRLIQNAPKAPNWERPAIEQAPSAARWPVPEFRELLQQLNDQHSCFFCRHLRYICPEMLRKSDQELEKDFLKDAKKLNAYISYPGCFLLKNTTTRIQKEYEQTHPQSPLFPLLSFLSEMPEPIGMLESQEAFDARIEQVKAKALAKLQGIMHLNNMLLRMKRWPQMNSHASFHQAAGERGLLAAANPELFHRIVTLKDIGGIDESSEKLLDLELLRYYFISHYINFLKDKNIDKIDYFNAALISLSLSCATQWWALMGGSWSLAGAISDGRKAINAVLYSPSNGKDVKYHKLSEHVSYGFDHRSTGTARYIPLCPNFWKGSQTAGYIKIKLKDDSEWPCRFDFREPDLIPADQLIALREWMRDHLNKGSLDPKEVLDIMNTLQTKQAELMNRAILNHRTTPYFLSLLPSALRQTIQRKPDSHDYDAILLDAHLMTEIGIENNRAKFNEEGLPHLNQQINQLELQPPTIHERITPSTTA
ncbi:MAG: hypothetical protein LLG04_15885 [Parachlamydia sp.]|nr:hypothetical protein [Parachlamydia sp.]